MENNNSHQITHLLIDWSKGAEYALERLMPVVYGELRQMPRRYMSKQPAAHTFRATELIHETYVKLDVAIIGGGHWWNDLCLLPCESGFKG